LLALLVTASLTTEAHASFIVFTWDSEVTGGTFVNNQQLGTFASDQLSMSIFGDYSFTATSNSATVTVSALLLLPSNQQGAFSVNASIDGSFASDLSGSTARITEYSASSYLANLSASGVDIFPGTTALASTAGLPDTLPTATADFPVSALDLQASASTPVVIPQNSFLPYLGQSTTIQFDMLTVGETIRIDLPDNSSLTPATVPEPPSGMVCVGLSSLLAFGAVWRRNCAPQFAFPVA
jgi:hypothetical protein